MKLLSHKDSIIKIDTFEWLFDELVLQIEKDFHLFDEPLALSHKSIPALEEALVVELKRVLVESPSFFSHMLYGIDVSEEKLRREMSAGTFASLEYLCAKLILEREIKKVVTRNILSGKIPS